MKLNKVYCESSPKLGENGYEQVKVTAYDKEHYDGISLIHIEHLDLAREDHISDVWKTTTNTGAALQREAILRFDAKVVEVEAAAHFRVTRAIEGGTK
jgi:hypothetical protein